MFPDKKYGVIYADPPWYFKSRSKKGEGRNPNQHYNCMELLDICNLPVKDISGAGDTFLAGLVVDYVRTKDIEKSIKFAQECTKIVVQKHGVSTV